MHIAAMTAAELTAAELAVRTCSNLQCLTSLCIHPVYATHVSQLRSDIVCVHVLILLRLTPGGNGICRMSKLIIL